MTDRDRPELKRLLTKLAGVYTRTLDADTIDAYFLALKPLAIDAIRRACTKALSDCQYFPKPVELRGMASSSERPHYREVDGQPVYECLRCQDRGLELVERFRADGQSLGTFALPCLCVTGAGVERAWQQPNSIGDVFAETARDNARKVRALAAGTEPMR